MRRHSLLALSALLVLSGCSGGGARSLGPVPTAPTTSPTTTVRVTSTSTTAPSTTAAPTTTVRATTPTTAGPRLVNGIPQVTATPARAPIGGRVRVEGIGFTDGMWRAPAAPLWLASTTGGCSLYAELQRSVTVSPDGRLAGEFTVPLRGGCRMSDESRLLTAGTYRIVFGCTACFVGELVVTTSATACRDVAFAPNTDNLASDVVAAGMDCAEAEAVVRAAGAKAGPVNGPVGPFDVSGFSCVRTGASERGLPWADYACDSGSKTLTFHRT